uniref:TPT domain-containing protein n=1 Tax=Meloidogyne hapla TaxID=6305 RepID=A0A1I8BEX1_MELHA
MDVLLGHSMKSYISLNCLDGISLPFFPFLEKFIAITVIPFYFFILRRQRPSILTLAILLFICIGSALASVFEVSYDIWGLAYSLGALAMQTSSLVLIEKVRAQMDMSVVELIYLNSFNCLCLFLVADIVQDELRDAYSYLQTSTTTTFYICLLAMIIAGSFGHCLLLYCVATTNTVNIIQDFKYKKLIKNIFKLNTAITQNCSASIQVFIAYLLSIEVFYDSEPNFTTFLGVIIALISTAFYFISSKDKELKPNGCYAAATCGGAKYHSLVQHE